jgi:hypothetical protein
MRIHHFVRIPQADCDDDNNWHMDERTAMGSARCFYSPPGAPVPLLLAAVVRSAEDAPAPVLLTDC